MKPNWVQQNIDLKHWNTMGVGGKAEFFAAPRDEQDLMEVLKWIQKEELPCFVLGGGSNCFFEDKSFQGVILYMGNLRGFHIQKNQLVLGSGCSTPKAVHLAAKAGLSGLECIAGIPGTIGGAVAMNGGGKYGEISESLGWVKWISWDGEIVISSKEDLDFGYRSSHIPGIILEVALDLITKSPEDVQKLTREILMEKKRSQPFGVKSSGCIFKNPKGRSAGQLIDLAGLKGKRVGDGQISPLHGNFFVNLGNATAQDLTTLMEMARQKVYQLFGVWLEREVRFIDKGLPLCRVA